MAVDPKLFQAIKAQDPDIADVYADLMKDKTEIGPDGIDRLLGVAAKDKKITAKEAAAIKIVLAAKLLTLPAFDRLKLRLLDPNGLAVFLAGGKPLETDKDLEI